MLNKHRKISAIKNMLYEKVVIENKCKYLRKYLFLKLTKGTFSSEQIYNVKYNLSAQFSLFLGLSPFYKG